MTAEIYKNNRQRLVEKLPQAEYILVVGNSQIARSRDTAYKFRQDSNVLYISGIDEPKVAILIDVKQGKSFVVAPGQTKTEQIFEGTPDWTSIAKDAGLDGNIDFLQLKKCIARSKELFMNIPNRADDFGISNNPYRGELYKKIKSITGFKPKDARPELAQLRVIKQPYEITNIQKAIDITKGAIHEVTQDLKIDATEKNYENLVSSIFAKNGVDHAYLPIVASGSGAAVLHHLASDKPLENNSALLFDVGAEFNGYSADISRTFIIGDNKQQQSVVDDVTQVQSELISMLRPGLFWKDLHAKSIELIIQVIINNNLGDETNIKELYPHSIGHFVGLDTHDVGDYTKPLEQGMVLTIEPGIYSKALGFGVRIEDEVLIKHQGAQVL